MSNNEEKSVKKKRRLKLNGPDNEYAKRDAVNAHNEKPKTATVATKLQEEPSKPVPQPEQVKALRPKTKKDVPPLTKQTESSDTLQIPVNLRLPVGVTLSSRLTKLADMHGQALEPILKTARGRAAERFNSMIQNNTKPEQQEFESGGEVTRFAATFSGETAERLVSWYDPFSLGVAKDGIKPIMTKFFQDEVAKICDTVK